MRHIQVTVTDLISFRRVQEQEFIRSLLGNVIEQVLAKANVSLEIQPMKVYKDLINEEEMTTGGQSTLNPDATEAEVRSNPRVQEQLKKRVRQLIELSDLFINAIINSLDFFPYGLRWISKQIRLALNSKFKNATNTEIMPIIGWVEQIRACACRDVKKFGLSDHRRLIRYFL